MNVAMHVCRVRQMISSKLGASHLSGKSKDDLFLKISKELQNMLSEVNRLPPKTYHIQDNTCIHTRKKQYMY